MDGKGPIELRLDLTGRVDLPGPLETAAWLFPPARERRLSPPLVVFAFPGGTYSKQYYHHTIPGHAGYSLAQHLAGQGIVFVACDHLGVGESSRPEPASLSLERLAAANQATVTAVTERLERGEGTGGTGPIRGAFRIGVGHSMGACLLTVQQSRHASFDAVAILGWSAIHTQLPVPPEGMRLPQVPAVRASLPVPDVAAGYLWMSPRPAAMLYAFHFEDVPREVVAADEASVTTCPPIAGRLLEPRAVAEHARRIDVPVLLAFGERDVSPDPHAEPAAYPASRDVTLFVLPRAAHCFNYASTRTQFYERFADWARSVSGALSATRELTARSPMAVPILAARAGASARGAAGAASRATSRSSPRAGVPRPRGAPAPEPSIAPRPAPRQVVGDRPRCQPRTP